MPRGFELTDSEKKSILELSKKKHTHREIASKINRSKTVVTNFLKNPEKYCSVKRTGRNKKVSPRVKRLIINKSSNAKISAKEIISEYNLYISKTTVNRVRTACSHLIHKKKTSPVLSKSTRKKGWNSEKNT